MPVKHPRESVIHHPRTANQVPPETWRSGQIATGKRFIPNLPVITHLGENRMFYDDLLRDRTVILQFMSIKHAQDYPATRSLVRIQSLLGERLGRDVFMYSITVDPVHDTLDRLKSFADCHRAGPGWKFLTGEPTALAAIKTACFFHGVDGHHDVPSASWTQDREAALSHEQPAVATPDCSLGLLRYGNDRTGLWGSVPAKTDPLMIVERLSWILPRARPVTGRLKRRGPFPGKKAGV